MSSRACASNSPAIRSSSEPSASAQAIEARSASVGKMTS
jgi:hypothetical protein